MHWADLCELVGDNPLFESSLLATGDVTAHQVHRQLSDWTRTGKIIQLRRGLYAMPERRPHPFVVANRLVAGSYVSLQMAMAHYHLIPEHVAVVTSVTTRRPTTYNNVFGRFSYRHITPNLFYGIVYRQLVGGQYAFVATPEKALLDLIHLRPQGDDFAYIDSLRLQQMEQLDLNRLTSLAERSRKPKLRRAAAIISELAHEEAAAFEPL